MSTIRDRLTDARKQEMLTVNQFALLTQYNPQTVYRKVAAGEIPGVVRFGGGIRIDRSAALAYAREQASRDQDR